MTDRERKSLVWAIRKSLLSLSPNELFQVAENVGSVPGKDPSELLSGDAEVCFEYIHTFMHSKDLLDSEDMDRGELLALKDVVDEMVQPRGEVMLSVESSVNAEPMKIHVTSPLVEVAHTVAANAPSTDAVGVVTTALANTQLASNTASANTFSKANVQ